MIGAAARRADVFQVAWIFLLNCIGTTRRQSKNSEELCELCANCLACSQNKNPGETDADEFLSRITEVVFIQIAINRTCVNGAASSVTI